LGRLPKIIHLLTKIPIIMEMNSDKPVRIALVIVSLTLIWSLIMQDKYKKLSEKPPIEVLGGGDISKSKTIDSLQYIADSKVIVFRNQDQVHIYKCEDDLVEGTAVRMSNTETPSEEN